jgi:drug/metabolite transporter (DMT)-like permease
MIEFGFEFEINIDGPFAKRHPLERVACGLFFLSFVLFGNFVPLALAVWLVLVGEHQPNQPPPPFWGWFFVGGILVGMFAIGGFCIALFVRQMTCGRLSGVRALAAFSLVSLAVAVLSVVLDVWQPVFLVAVGGVLLCSVLTGPIAKIGQALTRRRATL